MYLQVEPCRGVYFEQSNQVNQPLAGTGNLGTSMISKSQEETEVSERLEEKALEAEMRRLG